VCARRVPRELKDRDKMNRMVCPCNISYAMQMKENKCLTGLLLGTNHGWCITTNPNQSQTPYNPSNPGEKSRTTVETSRTSALQPGLGPYWLPSVWSTKKSPWWQTFSWWRRGWNGCTEVAEITVKTLLCCGFRRTGKAMGQVYQSWWRICRERNSFSRFEYHMYYVLYLFVIYLLTLPRI
jgi:hypothetical protein